MLCAWQRGGWGAEAGKITATLAGWWSGCNAFWPVSMLYTAAQTSWQSLPDTYPKPWDQGQPPAAKKRDDGILAHNTRIKSHHRLVGGYKVKAVELRNAERKKGFQGIPGHLRRNGRKRRELRAKPLQGGFILRGQGISTEKKNVGDTRSAVCLRSAHRKGPVACDVRDIQGDSLGNRLETLYLKVCGMIPPESKTIRLSLNGSPTIEHDDPGSAPSPEE